MRAQELTTGWTLEHAAGVCPAAVRGPVRQVGKETIPGVAVDAAVPGCVHTDLLRAGLIRDPYEHGAEEELQWIGLCDWRYACRFTPDADVMDHERVNLVFDGIDTVAEVSLNGVEIGRSINMHHPHRFNVRGVLKADEENELVVLFRSPVRWAEGQRGRLGDPAVCKRSCRAVRVYQEDGVQLRVGTGERRWRRAGCGGACGWRGGAGRGSRTCGRTWRGGTETQR